MIARTKAKPKIKVYGKVERDGVVLFSGIIAPKWRCYLQPSYWRYQKSKHPNFSYYKLIKTELAGQNFS